jgi:hypothetical protein
LQATSGQIRVFAHRYGDLRESLPNEERLYAHPFLEAVFRSVFLINAKYSVPKIPNLQAFS